MNTYKPVIGLEIHVELSTKSKMFCECDADYFGKAPNTHVCPVCLGLPGALPVPNKKAIEWTLLIGKALNCSINKISKFDRKHYFYPDLPKGYQISQYDEPFCVNGKMDAIRIRRVHLEEDTGKLLHREENTLVDFNRSGVPLVEIVTEPDFESSDEVKKFGEELQAIIRVLKVSDADMEKGSMRLEPNISVGVHHDAPLPSYKVEIKNINSFNFAKRAIDYEVDRHIKILEKGGTPLQETRGYNEVKGITVSQRTKEEAHDYRYFPEPDIPPFEFTNEYLESLFSHMPTLPQEIEQILVRDDKLKAHDAHIISHDNNFYKIYNVLREYAENKQAVANIIVNKKLDINLPKEELIKKAKELFTPKSTDNDRLKTAIDKVMNENQKAVSDFKVGQQNSLMFLIGQVMREMKGQADALVVKETLISKLK